MSCAITLYLIFYSGKQKNDNYTIIDLHPSFSDLTCRVALTLTLSLAYYSSIPFIGDNWS